MFENEDSATRQKPPWNSNALIQDLELNTLCRVMASDDDFIFKESMSALLCGLNNDVNTVLYRQNILKDCIANPAVIRDIYKIALEALDRKNVHWNTFSRHPSSTLFSAVQTMHVLKKILAKVRYIADEQVNKFKSKGFIRLFLMLKRELNDDYFAQMQDHLRELDFPNGILLSARLGKGNKSNQYQLHKSPEKRHNLIQQIFTDYILPVLQNSKQEWITRHFEKQTEYTFYINPRDESGARALSEIRDQGINTVANTLAQSIDHIIGFFNTLRTELAFYIGCLNLYDQLTLLDAPTTYPKPENSEIPVHIFQGLYDVCLALTMGQSVVGNDMSADGSNLVIITGANKGGKSTFLRSIGLSQLMMQCGMFVPSDSFHANLCDSLITHYKREEDRSLKSGKLDEELNRMSEIIDKISIHSILLFNESFAATNEREGSEIARQIVSALTERRIKVFFVTHLYEFAHGFYEKKENTAVFLRAERLATTERTYKLIEGEPLQTSYGVDLYNKIFGSV